MLVRVVEPLRRGELRALPGATLDLPVEEAGPLIETGTVVPVTTDAAAVERRDAPENTMPDNTMSSSEAR